MVGFFILTFLCFFLIILLLTQDTEIVQTVTKGALPLGLSYFLTYGEVRLLRKHMHIHKINSTNFHVGEGSHFSFLFFVLFCFVCGTKNKLMITMTIVGTTDTPCKVRVHFFPD